MQVTRIILFSLLFVKLANADHPKLVKPINSILNGRSAIQAFDQDVLKSNKPVIVKFYLNGCPPCNRMKPVFENLASELAGKVEFIEIEANSFGQLSDKYGIQSAPTFVFFAGGKEVHRSRGVQSINELRSKIVPYIK